MLYDKDRLLQEGYVITGDQAQLDYYDYIHSKLSATYWAKKRSFEATKTAFENSFVKLVLHHDRLIGFARLVTDYAIFGYLADVFIDESHRGKGLAKWLVTELLEDPKIVNIKKIMLRTNDAQSLYRQLGFGVAPDPERNMEKIRIL